MKKYEYVSVNMDGFLGSELEEHRQIIDDYAAKGYKYVGYIPTKFAVHAQVVKIDLIFEIDR